MLYDALIVGAGPAGCAAAYDLATAGRRVLLLDKRSFPRAKACACGLTRKTLKALRYSAEPVIERECRDVVLQEAGPAFLHGSRTADKSAEVRVRLRNPFCAMAVRERFDAFCLAQTLAHGKSGYKPELLKIETVTALREFPTHVELEVTLPGGVTETLRAPVLIGADGSNGQTRRLATGLANHDLSSRPELTNVGKVERPPYSGAPRPSQEATAAQLPPEPAWYARGFAVEATVPYTALPATLPAGDAPHDLVFDFAPIAGGYGWLFPKGDHINIGVGGFVPQKPGMQQPAEETAAAPSTGDPGMVYETVTRTLLNTYTRTKLGVDLAHLATLPGVHVSGQHLGLGGHAYTPQGRVLLTGDAAGLVDPLTGEGIHSALVSGQAAAAAILEVLSPSTEASSRPEAQNAAVERPASNPSTEVSSRPEAQNAAVETPASNPSTEVSSRPELNSFSAVEKPLYFGEPQAPGAPSSATASPSRKVAAAEATRLAAAYARHLQPLIETLTFSHRAARSFYREPERGFRVMRTPLLRSLVLKTYADGLPTTKLLAKLARRVA